MAEPRRRRVDRRALLLSGGGGVVFALTAPPTDFYPAVVLGLGALFLSLCDAPSAKSAAWRAWVWATAAQLVGLRFVPVVIDNFTPLGLVGGALALLLLSAFQALTWALGGVLFFGLARRARLAPPLAFGGGVFLAVSIPTVMSWSPAAVISPWPAFIQLAELVGERGVSLLLAVASALLVSPLVGTLPRRSAARLTRPWLGMGLGLALLVVMGVHGALRLGQVRAVLATRPSVKLGVVQGAVPARLRWERAARYRILHQLRQLTRQAEAQGVELVVWPEAAYPFSLPHRAGPMPRRGRAIVGSGVRGPVLFGTLTRPLDREGRYNAATIVDPSGFMHEPQAKLELLWFGETVPFGQYLPWLRRVFFRAGGLIPGDRVVLLPVGEARIGILNCYEDILPGVGRRVARAQPDLLVNVTNDAWFGPTSEGELHLRLSVLRAVETRLDLVRAVNFGVPAWIDASGTIRARGPVGEPGLMVVSASLAEPAPTNELSPTLYSRAGDIPLWLGLLFASAAAAFGSFRRARAQPPTERGP